MARYLESKCKQCLREHQKLFLKGDRCFSNKCAFTRRNGALPGSSKYTYRRSSDFAIQFREKQKIKRIYGLLERQFRRYYTIANKKSGDTGYNLLELLELRMDNVVFRMGYAPNRNTARQLISHGHFLLNGKPNNIPSTVLKVNDSVSIKLASQSNSYFKNDMDKNDVKYPKWIKFDSKKNTGTVVGIPQKDDMDPSLQPSLVVEYYSR